MDLNCNAKQEGSAWELAYPHLRIGFIFNLEASVGSFGAETGGQGGFADTAPWIILLTVRRRALEGGGEHTLQVHCS